MRLVRLKRDPAEGDSIFGKLSTGTFECYTVENAAKAIPPGTWRFGWRKDSPKHGSVYECQSVPGRTCIQIHVANWADELEGCIALGNAIMDIQRSADAKKKGVSSSKDAIDRFVADMGKLSFDLEVS